MNQTQTTNRSAENGNPNNENPNSNLDFQMDEATSGDSSGDRLGSGRTGASNFNPNDADSLGSQSTEDAFDEATGDRSQNFDIADQDNTTL